MPHDKGPGFSDEETNAWAELIIAANPRKSIKEALESNVLPPLDQYLEKYPDDPLEAYLQSLIGVHFFSQDLEIVIESMDKLHRAIAPLRALIPNLELSSIEKVRREYIGTNRTKTNIYKDENYHWINQSIAGTTAIPGFDLDICREFFMTTIDKDPNSATIHEKFRKVSTPYVPYHLVNAEITFMLIVRMYRYQYLKNSQTK